MLKYIFMLFLLGVIFTDLFAQNQNCGQHINCDPLKQYAYRDCNNVYQCTNNPSTLSLSAVRAKVPICLEFYPNIGPTTIKLPIIPEGPGADVVVFDMADMQSDIDCAQDSWDCICGIQNSNCSCFVKIIWSSNTKDFEKPDSWAAQANTSWTAPWEPDPCTVKCKNQNPPSVIYLNNTPGFRKDANGYPTRTLVNSDCEYYKRSAPSGPARNTINICDAIMHELGHLYGIGHYDDYPCPSNITPTTGIMFSRLKLNQAKRDLTDDDKCAFARLYCNSVDVKESDSLFSQVQIKTYPTPTQSLLNIEFTIDRNAVDLIFQVFSETGKLVYDNGYFYTNHGINRITEDFSFLSNGIYFFKIYSEINIFSGKFVIAK